MKKLFIFLCAGIMTFMMIFGSYSIKAADKDSFTLKVGKKITIKTKMKNAVWGSDNTEVATVSSKGIVKGIAEGSCTIVATAKGKSELYTVKVIKAKKKNVIELYDDNDWYMHFKDSPVAYLDGIKITYYETTFSDLLKEVKNTNYTCTDYDSNNKMPKTNDLITNNFSIRIKNGKKSCAIINFKYTDSMIAKDAIISNVEIDYGAPSNFYYFNTKFKIKNVPEFENFKQSDLFSNELEWAHEDGKINGKNIVWCYNSFYASDEIQSKERYGNKTYTLYFAFDQSTHKCLYVTMR